MSDESNSLETSLLELLDLSQLTCLNESEDHTFKSIVASKAKNTTGAYVLSDVDEQLLLNITFNQTVKIRSIVLQTTNLAQAPHTIRLLTNQPSLAFDDLEEGQSVVAQEIQLTEEQVRDGKRIPLRFVRFQAVTSLHIFVVSNQSGEDQTRIDVLDVFGMPVACVRSPLEHYPLTEKPPLIYRGVRDLSGLRKQED
ncbi:Thioredoxin-like protein 1 [Grifola frondosa]|uniref:Thioredoxin-like protein 1 n=1 Tax=Grifola frondosa TaxID=5627 RepID=A0A1C7MG11_GRIFR|nr:Thioredoxin-like protein 1 [Grifola frondosa]